MLWLFDFKPIWKEGILTSDFSPASFLPPEHNNNNNSNNLINSVLVLLLGVVQCRMNGSNCSQKRCWKVFIPNICQIFHRITKSQFRSLQSFHNKTGTWLDFIKKCSNSCQRWSLRKHISCCFLEINLHYQAQR